MLINKKRIIKVWHPGKRKNVTVKWSQNIYNRAKAKGRKFLIGREKELLSADEVDELSKNDFNVNLISKGFRYDQLKLFEFVLIGEELELFKALAVSAIKAGDMDKLRCLDDWARELEYARLVVEFKGEYYLRYTKK